MQYEDAVAMNNGEWPDECYCVPHSEEELIAIIEAVGYGWTIRKDTPRGKGFEFGRAINGQWIFLTNEFLDADENTPNPDFRECRYDTVRDGVQHFTINGKRLFDCVNGCRIAQDDTSMMALWDLSRIQGTSEPPPGDCQ